jgi:hypothetical protein
MRCNVSPPRSTLTLMAAGPNDEMSWRELVELVTDYLEGKLPEADNGWRRA